MRRDARYLVSHICGNRNPNYPHTFFHPFEFIQFEENVLTNKQVWLVLETVSLTSNLEQRRHLISLYFLLHDVVEGLLLAMLENIQKGKPKDKL